MTTLPVVDVDPFSDELLEEPYEYYRALRDAGPVVWLERYEVAALTRFEHVRMALRDWRTFTSTRGVAYNDALNEIGKDTVLCKDPPEHTAGRSTLNKQFSISHVQESADATDAHADALIARHVRNGTVEAVHDMCEPFVAQIAGQYLGLDAAVLKRLVPASSASFDLTGPPNERGIAAFEAANEGFSIIRGLTKGDLQPGSVGWEILDAAERDELPEEVRADPLLTFISPAFDTTINALGSMLWLLATHPDQYERLRSDRSLLAATVNETLRFESPLQIWSRFAVDGATVEGDAIPPETRVALFIGAGNRDERHYTDPDRFDIGRNPTDHLAFGHGVHLCLGAPLARLEMMSVLKALVERVSKIELVEAPTRRLNNTTRGFETLALQLH